jgi:hypothetical protein
MTTSPGAAPVTFKSIGARKRREVFELARKGEIHPDLPVAVAAYRWSHARRWESLANRLPGWLLPSIGIIFIAAFLVVGFASESALLRATAPVFVVGGFVVVFFGVMGWISTSSARILRTVYAAHAAADGMDESSAATKESPATT